MTSSNLISILALAAAAATPASARDLGFIVTDFAPAIHQGKGDCPNGLAGTLRENYFATLAPAERARLGAPENEKELQKRWQGYAFGPNNTNVCANPEAFPDRPTQKMIEGPVAYGLDLDGGAAECAHAEFASPDGRRGIDNQAYRAMGCTLNYRGVDGKAGDIVRGSKMWLASGEHAMVILVKGVDDPRNDDAVEVVFASTDDRPIVDSQQNFVTGASYTVSANAAHRNLLKGRIRNGVLTTDPTDMRLRRAFGHGGPRGAKAEWEIGRAQLRLVFTANGALAGVLGGYQTPRNVIISTIAGGFGAAVVASIDCAAEYNTMLKLADGYKDPSTGRCTRVSTGLDIAAVPAFVFDRAPGESAP